MSILQCPHQRIKAIRMRNHGDRLEWLRQIRAPQDLRVTKKTLRRTAGEQLESYRPKLTSLIRPYLYRNPIREWGVPKHMVGIVNGTTFSSTCKQGLCRIKQNKFSDYHASKIHTQYEWWVVCENFRHTRTAIYGSVIIDLLFRFGSRTIRY